MALSQSVSSTELAHVLGLTPARVRQLVTARIIARDSDGNYPLALCVQSYIAYVKAGRGAAPVTDEQVSDKERLVRAQADLAEMEAGERRGDLIGARATASLLAARDIAIKDRLLAVPMAGADRAVDAHRERGAVGIADVYRAEITTALRDLSSAEVVPTPAH